MGNNDIQVSFECPQITADPVELAALGISVEEPQGQTSIHHGRIEIGVILVAGSRIWALPFTGLTAQLLAILIGAAERAFHRPPKKADGWRYTREGNDPRWVAYVSVDVCESVSAWAYAAEELMGHPRGEVAA